MPSIEGVRIVDSGYGIGYIRLSSFQKNTNRDLDAALWKLHRLGMRSLILDLRGNPGGLLSASVAVADKFLTQGNIVSTRGRNPQEAFRYDDLLLVEPYLDHPRELETAVMGNTRLDTVAYGPGEVRPGREFYDYVAKYQSGDSEVSVQAPLDAELAESIRLEAEQYIPFDMYSPSSAVLFWGSISTSDSHINGRSGTSQVSPSAEIAGTLRLVACFRFMEVRF